VIDYLKAVPNNEGSDEAEFHRIITDIYKSNRKISTRKNVKK
jgi:hypothetical protein